MVMPIMHFCSYFMGLIFAASHIPAKIVKIKRLENTIVSRESTRGCLNINHDFGPRGRLP